MHCTSKAADPASFKHSFLRRQCQPDPQRDWWFDEDLAWWTLERWEGLLEIGGRTCGEIRVFACNPFGVSHPDYSGELRAFDDELCAPGQLDAATLFGVFALEMHIHVGDKQTKAFAFGDHPRELATESMRRFNATYLGSVHRGSAGIRASPGFLERLPTGDPCDRRRPWLDRYLTQGPSYIPKLAQVPSIARFIPDFRRLSLLQRPSELDMK